MAGILFAATAIAAALIAILATVDAKPAAAGWLAGFLFWCGPPLGSLAWMMIHRLTGGRWGVLLHSVFASTAALIPVLAVLLVPSLIAMPALYRWIHGGSEVIPSVAQVYLNVPSFIARSVVAFVGCSILSVIVPLTPQPRASLLSALGLIFYGLVVSFVPVDWVLTLEYPFVSESFGASVAITQLIAALAWAAALAPDESKGVEADLGGLLLATVLGITYVDFMALLVIWYGDLPDKVFWFVERNRLPWSLLALFAFMLGAVLPIAALLFARVRTNRRALRIVGATTLAGLAVYDTYLVVPPFGWLALIAAVLAFLAIGALLAGLQLAGLPATLLLWRGSSHAS
jgi:hypothetical protein